MLIAGTNLENLFMVVVYLVFMAGLTYAGTRLILAITRRNSLYFTPFIVLPLSVAIMIQWRCKLGFGYACGFMSFTGGFTYHFWIALLMIVAGIVLTALLLYFWRREQSVFLQLKGVLFAVRALAGVSIYAVWVSLPVPFIHFPDLGGSCPNIPLVCHDIPLLGLGGAFWYIIPFVLLASAGYLRHITQSFRM